MKAIYPALAMLALYGCTIVLEYEQVPVNHILNQKVERTTHAKVEKLSKKERTKTSEVERTTPNHNPHTFQYGGEVENAAYELGDKVYASACTDITTKNIHLARQAAVASARKQMVRHLGGKKSLERVLKNTEVVTWGRDTRGKWCALIRTR